MNYKLSPSDFAYLYQDCKHCYYLKVKKGLDKPRSIMPGVFSAMNSLIQGNLIDKNLKSLSSDLPDCTVVNQEGFITSTVIPDTDCYIKGKYDLLCKNPDDTYTVVDLKISKPDEEKIDKYKTQLYAYKYSLEHPQIEKPVKITRMGLLIFYPDTVELEEGSASLEFPPIWMEIQPDDKYFLGFIKEIDTLIRGDIPESTLECSYCKYFKNRESIEG